VVLPVFNGGAYLEQSVYSVLDQELKEFELLILDDCSTDGSYMWLQELKDSRIKLFKNDENRGLFYNLNFLIQQTKSPLIKLWAQDDIMYSDCLSTFVNFHRLHKGLGFSYSGRDIIDNHGNLIFCPVVDNTAEILSTEEHARIAYITGSIAGNIANVCIVRHAFDKVGAVNEQMKISGDFDMWVRLAEFY
jgi:glycosyltransferase involved in cell wall biosynthesis